MNSSSFELTLEQQFEMRRLQEDMEGMNREQAIELLLQVAELLMLRDNVIRDLMRQVDL
ncbi:MAG: photosystem I reaction center subunit XII [Leptolyngbyaceae cyanobacterium SL_7_1]|nr:photosystem I reaction center subunit XII [Leptolyngbyaceae cyanobacterium SL_7_1]